MMWKHRSFPGPAWYDPSVVPFAPVPASPRRDESDPRSAFRRKIPVGQEDITPIGPVSADEPHASYAGAIARRERDALEQVRAPSPEPPAPEPVARSAQPIDPELHAIRARLERDATRAKDQDRRALLAKLLPVLDNLDRSINAAASSPDQGLVEGIRLVRSQFESVLADLGATRVHSVGRRFDPAIHEAIALAEVDDPSLDGAVVDEWEAGYLVGDRVLRPARVRVGKLRTPEPAAGPDSEPQDWD